MRCSLLSSLFFAAGLLSVSLQAGERKNILFIAVDDLKPTLGCYDDGYAITPHIDALASTGTLFSQSYCQQAVCGPSRASVMTGLRPDQTEVWDLKTKMRDKNPELVTLPQHLRELGYQTTGVGKIFDPRCVDKELDAPSWSIPFKLGYQLPYPAGVTAPVQSAFQSARARELAAEAKELGLKGYGPIKKYFTENGHWPATESADVSDFEYTDSAIAEAGKRHLANFKESDSPFFLAVGFKKPHLPFVAPKKYWDLYERDSFKLHPFQEKSSNPVDHAYHNSGEFSAYTGIGDFDSFSENPKRHLAADTQRELIHGYYACVSYIDTLVGGLVDELDRLGLREDTVIVLWGDHGWHLGDHGLWCKHSNFEQATRVPLIFSAAGVEQGGVATAPVEFVDVFSTLCDLAGVALPENTDGKSLVPMLADPTESVRDYALSQWPMKKGMGYSIRDERYRYTEWIKDGNTRKKYSVRSVVGRELYDYETDPHETKNLVDDPRYADVVKMMKPRIRELFAN